MHDLSRQFVCVYVTFQSLELKLCQQEAQRAIFIQFHLFFLTKVSLKCCPSTVHLPQISQEERNC